MEDIAPVEPKATEQSGTLPVASMILGFGGAVVAFCTGPIGVLMGLAAVLLGVVSFIKRRPLPWASGIGLGTGAMAIVFGLFSSFIMTMAYLETQQASAPTKSRSNLRAMGTAMQLIARESPTNLPTHEDWQARLKRHLDQPETFISPFAKPGEISYVYICPRTAMELRWDTIVIYENPAISAPDYRALMGDWSVQTFSGNEMRLRTQRQIDARKTDGR